MLFTKRVLTVVLWVLVVGATARPLVSDTVQRTNPRDTLPVPPNSSSLLFYVQRTSNINTIIYDLTTTGDKKPDADNLVHIYWIRYAEQSQKEELSYIQRTFAYGLNIKPGKSGEFEMSFVSYKKMKLQLQYSEQEKRYVAYAQLGTKKVRVKRFFVKIDGGTFWVPKVTYVEIKGTDSVTGNEVVERFKPQ